MLRRTKIVATLGPASDRPGELARMIEAGLDVARINFSHGDPEDHKRRVTEVRDTAKSLSKSVGIMGDLQGPKIRIDRFKEGAVMLVDGQTFIIDPSLESDVGDIERVGVAYKDLPRDVNAGDTLMLDDGNIILKVASIEGTEIRCIVEVGGELSNHKGINRRGGGLTAAALTEKDHKDIRLAADLDVDYLAISFVRNAVDMHVARELMNAVGCKAHILSKIERSEAIENIEEIIDASDIVMIARGDLGIEIGNAALPGVQKTIISEVRKRNRVAVTATQMMQSMVDSPQPTRAEVLDVANAVLDGSDCVMLSAETAVGKHPAKVIRSMHRICLGAETHPQATTPPQQVGLEFKTAEEAVAMATMFTANRYGVTAILALTESGSTPKWMSRIPSGIPIYAVTRHNRTQRRVTMYRGVYPIDFSPDPSGLVSVDRQVIAELVRREAVNVGDWIIITKGDLTGVAGGTNTMKLLQVE